MKARRRRRRAIFGVLGGVAGLAALLALFALVAPGPFDRLLGQRIGIRTAWNEEAVALRAEGRALLLKDDRASLQAAIEKLAQAHDLDPDYPEAAADLAAAHFLLASIIRADARHVVDEASAVSEQMRAVTAKMKKLHGARYARLEAKAKALREELAGFERRSTELLERAGRLNARGYELAKENLARNERSTAAMAALVLYYGLEDEPGPAETIFENIQAFGESPPMALLGRAWLSVTGEKSERRREEALERLGAVLEVEPDCLRARAGRVQALLDLGRAQEAEAERRALLEMNPKHPVDRLVTRPAKTEG